MPTSIATISRYRRQRFESHLKYLKENGYHAITLDELLDFLTTGKPLPEKPVILTFDDGYADNYTNAFPLLQKYGMIGHFFIITDFVNEKRAEYMTWPQIEEMSAAGQRFGSHSRDHPDLKGKPDGLSGMAGVGGHGGDPGAPGLSPALDQLSIGQLRHAQRKPCTNRRTTGAGSAPSRGRPTPPIESSICSGCACAAAIAEESSRSKPIGGDTLTLAFGLTR